MAKNLTPKTKSCVFGPVASRRLGRSLGVDLIPYKTCTYDCLYCQVGITTDKTIKRQSWVDVDTVIAELKGKLASKPDYITLSGSGEPTLYKQTGELIGQIKQITSVPVAVLTNGSLLWMDEVRQALMQADLVVPSLDAGSEEVFRKINRPHAEISFEKMLDGLIEFRRKFDGKYWLEVFIIAGINDGNEEVDNLARCIRRIEPDRIQVNTVVRPPAEVSARPVELEKLKAIAERLGPNAEVIAGFAGTETGQEYATQTMLD